MSPKKRNPFVESSHSHVHDQDDIDDSANNQHGLPPYMQKMMKMFQTIQEKILTTIGK